MDEQQGNQLRDPSAGGSRASVPTAQSPQKANDAASADVPAPTTAPRLDPVKQLDYAKDAITQVMTLCSGILTISLIFSHNWAPDPSPNATLILRLAWVALLIAIILGIWGMSALAGIAYKGEGNLQRLSVRVPWLLQITAFLAGVCLLIWFANVAMA